MGDPKVPHQPPPSPRDSGDVAPGLPLAAPDLDIVLDIQAVLDTLVESAGRLCQSENVQIWLRDGEVYRLASHNGFSPEYQEYVKQHPISPGRGTLVARTALESAPIHIPDVLADTEYTWH